MNKYDKYKGLYITEGGCGTLLLGSSGLPLKKVSRDFKARGERRLALLSILPLVVISRQLARIILTKLLHVLA